MTPKGLLVQQNPGIQPLDITFLVLIDTTFYFVQAKELTASSSADLQQSALGYKSTFIFREQESKLLETNLLDFNNQCPAQSFCTYVDLKVGGGPIEIPEIIRVIKGKGFIFY